MGCKQTHIPALVDSSRLPKDKQPNMKCAEAPKLMTKCHHAAMQRYTIRDLNTGQLYVLDGDEGIASPDDPGSPASGIVTDIIQGRQLSLDEFEQLLGLNAVLEVLFTP